MTFEILSFPNGARIPAAFAFNRPATDAPVQLGPNKNPHLRWSDPPAGTQSFAVICVDRDVPTVFDHANQVGKIIAHNLPRMDFYHWVLVDIPATLREIPAGATSDGVTDGGKPVGPTAFGIEGENDYSTLGSAVHGGYDGPGPPWNDERLHHYYFCLYALDVSTLNLSGAFTGPDALAAMGGHILAQAEWVGTYTLNPDVG